MPFVQDKLVEVFTELLDAANIEALRTTESRKRLASLLADQAQTLVDEAMDDLWNDSGDSF